MQKYTPRKSREKYFCRLKFGVVETVIIQLANGLSRQSADNPRVFGVCCNSVVTCQFRIITIYQRESGRSMAGEAIRGKG